MHNSFICLRRKYMRRAHSQAIGCCRALFEARAESGCGLEFMDADSHVAEGCWDGGLAGGLDRGYEALGEHGGR
jgi:hypothetical protein